MGCRHQLDEFFAGRQFVQKDPAHGAGDQARFVGADTARSHAQVESLDINRCSLALQFDV